MEVGKGTDRGVWALGKTEGSGACDSGLHCFMSDETKVMPAGAISEAFNQASESSLTINRGFPSVFLS